MGKYASLESCIFGVFGSAAWQAEGINTYPSDFFPDNPGSEYLKVSIIAAGKSVNLKSVSGVLIIDIFTQSGNGPHRANVLSDTLDEYLVGKSFGSSGGNVQFGNSNTSPLGVDRDNPALSREQYTIPFSFFGV